jgi:outer membrane protein, heavy metal efflux system
MHSMRLLIVIGLLSVACGAFAEDVPHEPTKPTTPAVPAVPEVPAIPEMPDMPGLTLEECVAWTMLRHPRLTEAGFQIDQYRGSALQAGLYPNPRLDSGNPQTIGPQGATILTTGLTQEVVTAGKLKLDKTAALEAAHQAEWNRVRTKYDVLTQVRQEFFATLAAQRRRVLVESLLKLAQKSEKTSANLFKAEQVSETDVLLTRVERRRAELSVRSSEITLEGRKRQLKATIGAKDLQIESVAGSLSVPLQDFESEQVVAQVLYSNPLVQIAHLDITRNQFLLRRAEVDPIPNLSVQAGFQYSYLPINGQGDHTQGLIGIYLNIPLWDRNQGNIAAAHAALFRANASRDAVQLDLNKQLVDAIQRFRLAEQEVKSLEEGILPDAMRTLDIVQKAYERGEFDIIRLLQTQRSVFEANLDYITSLENRLSAAAEIAGLLQLDEFP